MNQVREPTETGSPFSYKNGELFCEGVKIEKIVRCPTGYQRLFSVTSSSNSFSYDEPLTPVYVYSLACIYQNVNTYIAAMRSCNLSGRIGYAIKANPNLELVRKMKEFGVELVIAVSGYEVLVATKAGFAPENILLNGNGKQDWEIKLALKLGVMLNIDSLFDAKRVRRIHEEMKCENEVKILLRIRPNKPDCQEVQLTVHEYVNTAERSKFGFSCSELSEIVEILSSCEKIKIIGVHCHFGSGISNPNVYEWLGSTISEIRNELYHRGVSISVINVGGGIGTNYYEKLPGFKECIDTLRTDIRSSYFKCEKLEENKKEIPAIESFISALSRTIPTDVDIILEPGRSLVAKAGVLVCKTLGVKMSSNRKIMVVDGSMNEVIRPCLYGAHHEIYPTLILPTEKWELCDIVGPICESSDFLGKQVPMQSVSEYVAVMDVGAYCSSMASIYNLKPHAAEILVNGNEWSYIRNRDTFEDVTRNWNLH